MQPRKIALAAALISVLGASSPVFAQPPGEPDARWLQKAQQPNLTPFRKKAYEQIALLRPSRMTMWMNPGGFDVLSIKAGSEYPARTLDTMGLDTLPLLAEALDDTTPTGVVEPGMRGDADWGVKATETKIWKVNEVVQRLIVRIAQHNFVLPDLPKERLPNGTTEKPVDWMPQYKQLVLEWYAQNQSRTLEERKIADVSDNNFRNRLDAVEWLGTHKALKAKPAIVQYINKTLDSKEKNSLLDAEMAESSLALGQIGDKSSLPVVQQVCRFLADGLKEYGVSGSMDLYTLFQAYQGRALLGEKAEGLQELKSLYEQCSAQMEPLTRKEYQERLQAATDW